MYKALHLHSGEEILTLGPAWRGRSKELRALTAQDLLVCQGCRQAVRLKAGPRKRPHFAHKHLQGCSYGGDSPRLLAARALLYEALLARFPGQVDAEWLPEGADLPRPVDCVLRAAAAPCAFWIVDAYLKLEARQRIQAALARLEMPVTWLMLAGMLRDDPNHAGWVLLSPTERAFFCQTAYDEIGREQQLLEVDFGSTLHYLNEESGALTTLRSLQRTHPPNIFSARREECALEQVQVSAQGELIHPGEDRALNASRAQRLRQVERARRWLEPPRKPPAAALTPAPAPQPRQAEHVTCIFCGEWTDDWWAAWLEDGERLGKCRACLERGLG